MYRLNQLRILLNRVWQFMILLTIFPLFLASCMQAGREGEPIQGGEPSPTNELAEESTPPVPIEPPTTPDRRSPEVIELTPYPTLPGGLEWVETPEHPPVVGEAPSELLEAIIADLAQRIGVDTQSIVVIRAESVVWNDGSLGCPKPGEFYTQALVNGYWVVLKVGESEYDYRASQNGYFFLCEGGGLILPMTPDAGQDYYLPPDS